MEKMASVTTKSRRQSLPTDGLQLCRLLDASDCEPRKDAIREFLGVAIAAQSNKNALSSALGDSARVASQPHNHGKQHLRPLV